MIQFYAPDIESTLTLPESDSGHAVKVLRMQTGDELSVVDGHGFRYRCRLTDAHSKRARVEIIEKAELKPYWSGKITIAVAPTKHMDRIEWLVEKLTEIGVDKIVMLKCRYSERKEIKVDRLEKIAVSAMKQSLKANIPEVTEMMKFQDFCKNDTSEQRFIAYCAPEIPRRLLTQVFQPGLSTTVLIGPEGDFSAEEIEMALDAGYKPISLGEARLRTETAALVACDTIHIMNSI